MTVSLIPRFSEGTQSHAFFSVRILSLAFLLLEKKVSISPALSLFWVLKQPLKPELCQPGSLERKDEATK